MASLPWISTFAVAFSESIILFSVFPFASYIVHMVHMGIESVCHLGAAAIKEQTYLFHKFTFFKFEIMFSSLKSYFLYFYLKRSLLMKQSSFQKGSIIQNINTRVRT